jgi:drug/metabolite transporter (DMT)-like permease
MLASMSALAAVSSRSGRLAGAHLPGVALATTILLWASAFAAIRAALRHFGPEHLSVLRLAVASVALAAAAAARGGVRRPARGDLPLLALVAFTGMTAYQLLLNSGEVSVPAGTASLLVNVSPLVAAGLAAGLLGERLTRRAYGGIALGFAGAALVAVSRRGGVGFDARALLVLGAAGAQATFFVAQKRLLARSRLSSLDVTVWAMWLGTAMALPFAPGLPHAVATAPLGALAAVLCLGVGASAIGFAAWAFASARVPVSFAASTLYAVPAVAAVVAWAWLGEAPAPLAVAGGAVALAGVALTARAQRTDGRRRRRPTVGPA